MHMSYKYVKYRYKSYGYIILQYRSYIAKRHRYIMVMAAELQDSSPYMFGTQLH